MFLVIINVRFEYQDTFPHAEANKGNAGTYILVAFACCLSAHEQLL
jgi:hypothetical protein